MNLIEKLGLEKCKQIVDGAPSNTNYKYYSLDLGVGAAGWHCDYRDGCFVLSDLRAAIADHNRTDYVSDIRNHISPMTKVIER